MTLRVAIFVSGGGSNMVALADSMTDDHPARAAVVLSNDATAKGLVKARARGIPTEVVDHHPFNGDRKAFEAAISERLAPYEPDVICLAGFMRVLTPSFTVMWQGRMLNIHPSLLPKYKGLHTHARALEAKDHAHGCTVHLVTGKLDDGPILGQASVPIYQNDTPQILAARVLEQEHILYPQQLRRFCQELTLPTQS
jgi:phosphoribosylglycinamide formyltransferase-1